MGKSSPRIPTKPRPVFIILKSINFFSEEYVRKTLLKQSEEQMLEINAQINREQQRQLEAQEQQMYQQMLSGEEMPPEEEQAPEEEQGPPQ